VLIVLCHQSSSTNSSSSRRTFTSTSSHHPLPARPDWAVGLKPLPTLHPTHNRHHDRALHNSRTGSPARNGVQSQSPTALQVADFPPLTTLSSVQEKRAQPVTGAWTNTSSMRSILTQGPSHSIPGSALVHHSSPGTGGTRLEEQSGFERPIPKGSVELFNPKGTRYPAGNGKSSPQSHDGVDKERPGPDVAVTATFAAQIASISLEDTDGSNNVKDVAAMALST
jgi:hypothetical protein